MILLFLRHASLAFHQPWPGQSPCFSAPKTNHFLQWFRDRTCRTTSVPISIHFVWTTRVNSKPIWLAHVSTCCYHFSIFQQLVGAGVGILGSPCTCPEQAVDPCAQDLRRLEWLGVSKNRCRMARTWWNLGTSLVHLGSIILYNSDG